MKFAWLPDSVTIDAATVGELTLLWGLDAVVLQCLGSVVQRVPDVNEVALRKHILDAGIEIAAVDPGMFEGRIGDRVRWLNELSILEALTSFCRRVSCEVVQVSSFEDARASTVHDNNEAIRELVRRCDSRLTVAVKNERDGLASDIASLAALKESAGLSRVTCSWCPATSMSAGEDPIDAAGRMPDSLAIVRCSDVGRGGEKAPFGEGTVPWPGILAALANAQFSGVLCMALPEGSTRAVGLRTATHLIQSWRLAATGR